MTVLVGYVPTPLGEATLRAGVEESRRRTEPLLVVNMSRDDKLVDAHRAQSADLDRLDADLAESGVEHEVRRIEHGTDASDQLLEVIEREHPRMLVIGIRHRSPVGKLLLGSTAQRLLLDAACPVLAVKAH